MVGGLVGRRCGTHCDVPVEGWKYVELIARPSSAFRSLRCRLTGIGTLISARSGKRSLQRRAM